MAEKIEIVVPAGDLAETRADLTAAGVEFESATSRGADGAEFASVLLTLGPATIAGVASVYVAKLRARRFVRLKYKGLLLEGVSDASIGKVLEQIAKTRDEGDRVGRE